MQVPPHPHIGLQTVTWLFQGLVLHRDSLGSRQLIRPGELNLMTAGRGVTHSEESAVRRAPADVVELRGPRRRRDRAGARGLGGRAVRPGPRLPRRPADGSVAAARPPQAPLSGTGSFLAGITGAGL